VIVVTRKLTKSYGAVTALDSCSLGVQSGEVFGLLGPNGAGKTTLIRLLLGFLNPTSGDASVAGLDCHRQSVQVRKTLSYLPAEAALFPHMRGLDVLRFLCDVRPGGNWRRYLDCAARLELIELKRRVSYMSTGMKQKLALAAALAADVPLYVLDEPTSNLDPNVRATVLAMVAQLRKQGRTVMFSSHVLPEVEEACDRVVILRAGRLVHTQTIAELRMQHRIMADLSGPLPPIPAGVGPGTTMIQQGNRVLIETPGELAPLLGWLATLPLADVRIEPVGLRTIYDRFHAGQASRQPMAAEKQVSAVSPEVAEVTP
jgi:beta-exotoxin I transport system ATP-binding protein